MIKGRYFRGQRHIHVSKQFKLSHWKKVRIQQYNFSEQHRHKNWIKQGP